MFSFSRPLQLGLQATYGEFFEYQENATTAPVEAAGQYNYQTGVASALPQLRANLRMSWNKGNHAVIGTARYVDSLPYGDSPQYTFMDAITNTNRPGGIVETGIKAWADFDLFDTYRNLNIFGSESNITVGARNVFDREAQISPLLAGVLAELQDPMGRVITARLQLNF